METANDVMPYAAAAIDAFGTGVLAKTGELAADTPAARGSRILQRVFGRGDARAKDLIDRVTGAKPDDEAGRTALRLAIEEAFQADPLLRREVAAMLPRPAWDAPVNGPGEGPVTVGGGTTAV